ncbi:MAG: glutamate racemase [Burkholderiaceae bacterium]
MPGTPHASIGVFDSGLGGLSVLRAIRAALPNEHLVYVADSANAPYGDRSEAFITERSIAIADFLIQRGAKAIVVACNTATAVAIAALRARIALPVIGIEPAVKPASATSESHVVGVLATTRTLASEKYQRLAARFSTQATLLRQPCPGWVERVEAGDMTSVETVALVRRYVEPLLAQGADTLVLGCTHYPFLSEVIAQVAGPRVKLIEPGAAVARVLQHRLAAAHALASDERPGREEFWASDSSEATAAVATRLWGRTVQLKPLARGA